MDYLDQNTDPFGESAERMIELMELQGCDQVDLQMTDTLCAFNCTRESFLSLSVARADTHFARLKGLLGKASLKSDEGLWTIPCQGIHTICLLFPIDLVYLDARNRVVHLVENLGTFRISPIRTDSASVLQLRPRTIFSSNTQVGDEMLICCAEEFGWAGAKGLLKSMKGALDRMDDRRRAPRIPDPEARAYFWNGSAPIAHHMRDISRTGAYMYTSERWYLGTTLQVTLDANRKETLLVGPDAEHLSVTVWSKIVRHGLDGVGMEFVLTKPGLRERVDTLLAAIRALSHRKNDV